MKRLLLVLFSLTIVAVPQTKPEPLDGPNRPFHDELLDNLQGKWKITGIIMGKSREMDLSAEWTLNHQFLFVHEKDAAAIEGKQPYDAHIYIGFDNTSDRYVIHWIDIFGGRVSETLGYGTRSGNSIKFVFEYPDGPFHNTFTWNADTKTWRFLLEQKNAEGKWTVFADQTANKVK
jgi:hypothetical protein